MRVGNTCYTKITFPNTIKLFKLYCRKGRWFYGEERICISTYEMGL